MFWLVTPMNIDWQYLREIGNQFARIARDYRMNENAVDMLAKMIEEYRDEYYELSQHVETKSERKQTSKVTIDVVIGDVRQANKDLDRIIARNADLLVDTDQMVFITLLNIKNDLIGILDLNERDHIEYTRTGWWAEESVEGN